MGRKVEGAMVQCDGPTVRKSLGPGPSYPRTGPSHPRTGPSHSAPSSRRTV